MIFYGLLATVLLSPLPFGANRAWAWSVWALIIALLTILWLIKLFTEQEIKTLSTRFKPIQDIIIVFIAVLTWATYQAVIPASTATLHPLWSLTDEILNGSSVNPPISLTPDDGMIAVMRLLSYGLVFILSFYYAQVREKSKQIFMALMSAGLLYSLYGLVIYFGQFGRVLWFEHPPTLQTISSTFINRNHFATFAGLTLICTLGFLSVAIKEATKNTLSGKQDSQRMLEKCMIKSWYPSLIFLMTGTALLLTASRGGIFATLCALMSLLLLLKFNARHRNNNTRGVWALFIGLGGFIIYLSSELLINRLDVLGLNDQYRLLMFEQTWSAILTNPWLGFGLGSFEEVFTLYKDQGSPGSFAHPALIDYAHNTYLETLFELGIPAACALFYCFFRLGWICFKGVLTRKREGVYPASGLAATLLIAIHASVDFSLQLPAIAYTYALLIATACAQSFSSRR